MKRIFTLTIDIAMEGKRIESLLEKQMHFSRSHIAKLKRCEGAVLADGKPVRLTERLICGQRLQVILLNEKDNQVEPLNFPLDILYEDEDIIAVNKPSGMPSHPSRLHKNDTLANALKYCIGCLPHIITRLDKDTTGVVLAAKNSHVAALLTDMMKQKKIQKEYVAVVKGTLNMPEGEINAAIEKEENSIKRIVSSGGKKAVTKYEVLNTDGKYSLVKLIPITGRTHQLRVHMRHIGCPIYGDSLYATSNEEFMCLHCRKISFPHPLTGEKITINAPVPDTWTKLKEA